MLDTFRKFGVEKKVTSDLEAVPNVLDVGWMLDGCWMLGGCWIDFQSLVLKRR